MKITIKKFKSHTKRGMKKLKSRVKHHSIKNMAKRKHGKSKKSFGGIKGFKIPIVSKAVQNPLIQKAIKGAGLVALAGGVVQLVNQPQINSLWSNQIVRSITAYAGGDIVGAGTAYVLENPQLLNRVQGSSSGLASQAGFA